MAGTGRGGDHPAMVNASGPVAAAPHRIRRRGRPAYGWAVPWRAPRPRGCNGGKPISGWTAPASSRSGERPDKCVIGGFRPAGRLGSRGYPSRTSKSAIRGNGKMVRVRPRTEPLAHAEVNGYFGVEASMELEPPMATFGLPGWRRLCQITDRPRPGIPPTGPHPRTPRTRNSPLDQSPCRGPRPEQRVLVANLQADTWHLTTAPPRRP